MAWQQEGSGGWQWLRSGSPQVQQYSAKEWEAWRSGNWSEWTCTNCQTIGWSGQKKCRHCGVKKSYAAALSSTLLERLDTNQARRYITGLPATTTSRSPAAHCVWKRSSTYGSAPRRALCRLLWSRGGHETDQTRGESSQQSGRRCACARGVEEIVGTTAHRAEDEAKSSTTPEQETREQRRAEEARALPANISGSNVF